VGARATTCSANGTRFGRAVGSAKVTTKFVAVDIVGAFCRAGYPRCASMCWEVPIFDIRRWQMMVSR
jgi:hypothetical protein